MDTGLAKQLFDVIAGCMFAAALRGDDDAPIDPVAVFGCLYELAASPGRPKPLIGTDGYSVTYRRADRAAADLRLDYVCRLMDELGDVRKAYTLDEAAAVSGISRARLKSAIAAADLPSFARQRRRLVSADALGRWVTRFRSR